MVWTAPERMVDDMKCNKCSGIMVSESFYSQDGTFMGWRCVSCGEIIDEVILRNRREQLREVSSFVPEVNP